MACRGYATTSDLQDVLATAIDRLSALRAGGIAAAVFLDEDDPSDLAALAILSLDIARTLDPIFHEIAFRGGLGSRAQASAHAAYVSSAIAGNLDFELRERAERIAARRHVRHPDDEHRLAAVELGVGSCRRCR